MRRCFDRICLSYAIIALLLGCVLGCGGRGPMMGTVTGIVSLDGTHLKDGNINFEPVNGIDQTASGKIADGQFSVQVPVGKSKVRVTANKVIGQRRAYPGPESPVVDDVVELIPKKYNAETGLEVDVQRGATPASFELKSDPIP